MTQSSTPSDAPSADSQEQLSSEPVESDLLESELLESGSKPQPSYVKLAMRNMVKKRGTSLFHFGLTAIVLLSVLVGLAYLTR